MTTTLEERTKVLQINDDKNTTVKTLGITWNATLDEFQISTKIPDGKKMTKRIFLSLLSKIFDPLGFISPFIINAKIIMQEIWLKSVDWDDDLEPKMEIKMREWIKDCEALKQIKVPRCLITDSDDKIQVHVFSDASIEAYGAVAYVRNENKDGHIIRLIASKTKVTSLKAISIPRLELMAASVGVNLAKIIMSTWKREITEVYFWSDSYDVLWWIKQPGKKFKPFIANRVGSIQELTSINKWRYVPTKENPADVLSRGETARGCLQNKLWWNGPKFLQDNEDKWPKMPQFTDNENKSKIKCCRFLSMRDKRP